ncbi:hypothetical protein HYH03_016114 [Edaphochlamys debaryana]|uniref:Uncharacterized protein n=1 Tax=Edaphochlamys debaryana TaxID=47281 RepID=A0A836BQK6_9CHLO|nr:hypothetical protein HYH03_016114 [Edaphochlamys debaryana]|eukprot:KAG2485127.1 hypothetical protein HYH03_016114 [Edaphochlamys debaryana]
MDPTSSAGAPGPAQPPAPGGRQVGVNDVFDLKRPKNAMDGLKSGAGSVAKGVLGGVAGLVAAPIVGAQQGGLVGLAGGVVSGVVGAVVLPVTGVGIGLTQAVRGVANTPEAIKQSAQGKIWDEGRREWVEKDMIVVAEAPRQARGGGPGGPGRAQVVEVDYYAVLEVPRDATPDAIKRQYYVQARKHHPDKNPNNPEAHDKFQKLGEAYQVLGNAELRARYDAHGCSGLEANLMESTAFFAMLFGSDQFEGLVGELGIALAARHGSDLTAADVAREQALRVARLSAELKARLKRFVEGDEAGFEAAMREEAARLAKASFGETLLHTIGKVYDMQADIIAGGLLGGMAAKLREKGHNVKTQFKAVNAAVKVTAAQQRLEAMTKEVDRQSAEAAAARAAAEAQGGDAPPAPGPSIEQLMARQKLEEATLPLVLEAMWAANVLDIQATLKRVCKFVLTEEGVAKEELRARAAGLKLLGAVFLEAAAPEDGPPAGVAASPSFARRQFEEAMLRVVEKRSGAEAEGAEAEGKAEAELTQDLFRSYPSPLVLDRNVTITGPTATPLHELSLGFLRKCLLLLPGRRLALRWLYLRDATDGSNAGSGVTLVQPSSGPTEVAILDCAYEDGRCFSADRFSRVTPLIPRDTVNHPGAQRIEVLPGLPPGLASVPVGPAWARAGPAPPGPSACVDDISAPLQRRCWALVARFEDYASWALAYDEREEGPRRSAVVDRRVNTWYLCAGLVSCGDDIARIALCLAREIQAYVAERQSGRPPALPAPPAPRPAAILSAGGPSGGGGGGNGGLSHAATVAVTVAACMGGMLAILLLAAAGFVLRRRALQRRRRQQKGGDLEAEAGGGSSAPTGGGKEAPSKVSDAPPVPPLPDFLRGTCDTGPIPPSPSPRSATGLMLGTADTEVSVVSHMTPWHAACVSILSPEGGGAGEGEGAGGCGGGASTSTDGFTDDIGAAAARGSGGTGSGSGACAGTSGGGRVAVAGDDVVTLLPRVLGVGAFGRVYEGEFRGQRVAVKVFTHLGGAAGAATPLEQAQAAACLVQEVEVLGRVCHPNVVRLLAACVAPPRMGLVLELMDTSLAHVLRDRPPGQALLPMDQVLSIATDVASGLAYLHPTIVHRDVKPGNVLLAGVGGGNRLTAKLSDFGLSRLRSTHQPTDHPEAGTPPYTAPECFDVNNDVVTHAADMYSFGAVLWEMLSGREPWPGLPAVVVATRVQLYKETLPLGAVEAARGGGAAGAGALPKLTRLLQQCFDPEPLRRPAAAEAVKQLLLAREQMTASAWDAPPLPPLPAGAAAAGAQAEAETAVGAPPLAEPPPPPCEGGGGFGALCPIAPWPKPQQQAEER